MVGSAGPLAASGRSRDVAAVAVASRMNVPAGPAPHGGQPRWIRRGREVGPGAGDRRADHAGRPRSVRRVGRPDERAGVRARDADPARHAPGGVGLAPRRARAARPSHAPPPRFLPRRPCPRPRCPGYRPERSHGRAFRVRAHRRSAREHVCPVSRTCRVRRRACRPAHRPYDQRRRYPGFATAQVPASNAWADIPDRVRPATGDRPDARPADRVRPATAERPDARPLPANRIRTATVGGWRRCLRSGSIGKTPEVPCPWRSMSL